MKRVFSYQFDLDIKSFSFPLKSAPILQPDVAFEVNPMYVYQKSIEVQVILKEGDRYMEIDTDRATYIVRKRKFAEAIVRIYLRRVSKSLIIINAAASP